MVILKFRTASESKDILKKLKKMHKFTKELMECVEENYDEDDDDDEDFRMDEEEEEERRERMRRRGSGSSYRGRYRRGM